MNTKLIAIAATENLDLKKFKAYATKYQYRYGKIVSGFVKVRSEGTIARLVKDFKNFVNPYRFLDTDDVDDLTLLCKHGEWKAEVESPEAGCIVWTSKSSKHLVYATPNWVGEGEVPFQVNINRTFNDDDYYEAAVLKFRNGTPLADQKKLYLNMLKVLIDSL